MPNWEDPARPWNVTTWPAPCGRRHSGPTCAEAWPAWTRGDYRQARAAFDEVIRLRPEMRQAYYNRALAKFHLGDLPGAQADLTHLLADPKPPLRAYFLRARVRERQGDREGARRDREDGLTRRTAR